MSCNGSNTYGPIPAWSGKSTSTWVFHPLAPPESSVGINSVRPTLQVAQGSGSVKARPALRYSADMNTWDNVVAIDAANMTQANDGTKFGVWSDIQTGQKNFVQFGVEVQNDTGAAVEMAMVTLRVDRKG